MKMHMKGLATALLVIAGALGTAAPAAAAEGDECWIDGTTGIARCYADEQDRRDAVQRITGRVLVEEGESVQLRGALATYTLARFYENASYGGASTIVTHSSSTICSTGSLSNNLLAAWNDRISSFHSYYGCTTRLYENTGLGGASIAGTDLASLGVMNDRASSYKLD
jgi:hypothetical protein